MLHKLSMLLFYKFSVIVDELARWKASLLQRSDDTNHHIRILLHERQMLFGLMSENQKVLSRLKGAFDPLSVVSTQDAQNNSNSTAMSDPSCGNDIMSILGLAEHNLNTGKILQERLLGNNENRPKDLNETTKLLEDLSKLQLDTPAEEGLRQVNNICPKIATFSA